MVNIINTTRIALNQIEDWSEVLFEGKVIDAFCDEFLNEMHDMPIEDLYNVAWNSTEMHFWYWVDTGEHFRSTITIELWLEFYNKYKL